MAAKKLKSPKIVKTAKQSKTRIKAASWGRQIDKTSLWKTNNGFQTEDWNGLQVWAPVDPYDTAQRLEFRAAMQNAYVYRANWIITKLVAGQGYTTEILPRQDEELETEQLDQWKMTQPIKVPYLDKEMTPQQLQDFIDKLGRDMDLAGQIFNGYITAREQGRGVLAMTPIDRDEDTGEWQLPTSIQYIRPEFTLRPYLDEHTAEMVGVQIVGLKSTQQFILPIERTIYIENGFNQELFSDHYGDSQVDRVTDAANVLNLIFADDFLHAAEATWHQPKIFGIPIQPQDFGNEEAILDDFLRKNADSKGQDIAVVMNPDGKGGVTLLNSTTNSGNISGLETIVKRCIKLILAYYNLPGFMLSESEGGSLGGNANTEEIDMFINTEILPERIKLENMISDQYYDKILQVLFKTDDINNVPIKMNHKFNKPRITSVFRPDLYEMGKDMVLQGLIDKDGLIDMMGVEQFTKEKKTYSQGEDTNPESDTWKKSDWDNRPDISISWNKTPMGWQPPKPFSNQHGQWPKVTTASGQTVTELPKTAV